MGAKKVRCFFSFNFLSVSQNVEWVLGIFPGSKVLIRGLLNKRRISGCEPRNKTSLQCSNSLRSLLNC